MKDRKTEIHTEKPRRKAKKNKLMKTRNTGSKMVRQTKRNK